MVLDGSKSRFEEFKHFFALPLANIWIISSQIENFEINSQDSLDGDFHGKSRFWAFFELKMALRGSEGWIFKKFRDPLKEAFFFM